ncbi:MAG: FtsX-like permease family protein [Candidatus Taylorbacteria bacterium]|nr:FtsX-like permease family protein [Candidatus Taylorbacteria bacterium]
MTISDLLHETSVALLANKVRSGLTVLGIVIGIASVIAMLAIGQGAKDQIQSSIESLGSNLLTILPGVIQPGRGIVSSGRGSAQTLKNDDIAAIESIEGISSISPESSRRFQIAASTGNNTSTTVVGVMPAYEQVHNLFIAQGNYITDVNQRNIGRVAVVGATVATDLYGTEDPLGERIRINGSNFTIVGILGKKGGAGFSGPDDMVMVPLSVMQKILSGSDYLSTITISVGDKTQMNNIRDSITSILIAKHRVSEPDFSIISQEDILGALSQVVNTFTLFLASIAGISLLVGGIGIMNMMLTTVTERTREIGLRKAIGAKKGDIRKQFLVEAVMLTFSGGVVGVILGWLVSFLVSLTGLIQTQVSFISVALAFGVSAVIGIIFGYYPARRASNLNPIEALRFE